MRILHWSHLPAVFLALVVTLAAAEARAGGPGDALIPHNPSEVWIPTGITTGAAFSGNAGFVLGGEVSVVHFPASVWYGAVLDATYDFGNEVVRHRVAGEVGWYFVGVEGGYLGEVNDGDYRPGFDVRAIGTVGYLGTYVGWGHLFGEASYNDLFELGLLAKFPIPTSG